MGDAEEHPWWKAVGLPPALPRLLSNETNVLKRCWIRSDSQWINICGKEAEDPELGLCAEHIEELRDELS